MMRGYCCDNKGFRMSGFHPKQPLGVIDIRTKTVREEDRAFQVIADGLNRLAVWRQPAYESTAE